MVAGLHSLGVDGPGIAGWGLAGGGLTRWDLKKFYPMFLRRSHLFV